MNNDSHFSKLQVYIGAVAVLVACTAIAVGLLTPEIRRTLGLDHQVALAVPTDTPRPSSIPSSQPTLTSPTIGPTLFPTLSPQPSLVSPTAASTPLATPCARNKIAFDSGPNSISSPYDPVERTIYIVDRNTRLIETFNDLTRAGDPAWSPDGCTLAYAAWQDGKYAIFLMNSDGTNRRRITNRTNDYTPKWSPDGRQIVFTSDSEGNPDIFLMNSDGTNRHNITNTSSSDQQPNWSPDGRSIVFTSNRDLQKENDSRIYIMGIDGTNLRKLTDFPASEPAWSPSGKSIAFDGFKNGTWSIYSINIDGSGVHKLNQYQDFESTPAWSPDGRYIAFKSLANGKGIYYMNADGSNRRLLLEFDEPYNISWSPLQ